MMCVNQCLENKPRICCWVTLVVTRERKTRGTSSKLTLNYYTDDGLIRSRPFLLISDLTIFLIWLDFITDLPFNAFAKLYFILPSLFCFLDTWKIRGTGIILNQKCILSFSYADFPCTFWFCVMYKTSVDTVSDPHSAYTI